jgi:hypothetical protein
MATDAEAISLRSKVRGLTGPAGGVIPWNGNGYTATLDATNERFDCGDPWSDGYTALTISMWVKPTSLATNRILTAKTSAREFVLQTGGADSSKVRFSQSTSSSNWCETDTGRLVNGTWTHVVAIWNGLGGSNALMCYIYINGVDRTSTYNGTIQNSVADGSASIEINSSAGGANYLGAEFDEVAYWRANKLNEATAIYNGGVTQNLRRFAPLLWYRMGDDASDNFDSASGSKLLVDQMGRSNCTPVNTESGDKTTGVP